MSYCPIPSCSQPQNSNNDCFCLSCGNSLVLQKKYRIVKIIGQGGMGRTFLAIDDRHPQKRFCAIKQFFPQTQDSDSWQKARKLFDLEIHSLENLNQHAQIPTLYDSFEEEGNHYLVQEWIDGQNLSQIINEQGIFTEAKILEVLRQLLPVLATIHQGKIIHRDVKPENILRDREGQIFLVDFGAAKILQSQLLRQTGTVIGSAEYVAPEQLRGKATYSSDLYSLGVTCLYLLTGISPFELYSDFQDAWVWQDYLTQSISPELTQILNQMIARAISLRYQSARAVIKDLETRVGILTKPVIELPKSKIDLTQLEVYLKQQQWQQANQETAKLLLQAASQEQQNWLETDDLTKISGGDLLSIDRLWSKYSEAKFGFKVQLEIWQNLPNQNYRAFGSEVGWYKNQRWLLSKRLDYSLAAPEGHLPAISWWYGHAIWGLKGLFAKLDKCLGN